MAEPGFDARKSGSRLLVTLVFLAVATVWCVCVNDRQGNRPFQGYRGGAASPILGAKKRFSGRDI